MKKAASIVPVLLVLLAWNPASAGPAGANPYETAPAVSRNAIDDLVFARLKTLGIQPARLSSDAVFLRRAFLDTIGTLPTSAEARAFLDDPDPNKRAALVDRLLERPEFADYWAMKWSDVLRVKSEFPVNLWPNAVQAYHRWIRTSVGNNMPYDRFVRTLLTANGSNFRDPEVNFYRSVQGRDPKAIAAAVALAFMGSRVETWPAERLAEMAAFFSRMSFKPTGEWKEEIVYFDPDKKGARAFVFPDGRPARAAPGQDPRETFAAWLVAPNNAWFARAAVNRVWFWLLGRGIVHEPDDVRADNPPSNPELLRFLERELVAAHYDVKHVMRLILNSSTYQLSFIPAGRSGLKAGTYDRAGDANFAYALTRPLDAEVLVDAICQITGTSEQYSSAIPEPYTFVPPDVRSIALGDGSLTSTFLETFGRPPRDTGQLMERTTGPTASQRLYLLNSSDIQRRIQQSAKLQALVEADKEVPDLVAGLYLTILSRRPTDEEIRIAQDYGRPGTAQAGANPSGRRAIAQDVAWALLNSAEFRYRH